MRTEYCLNNFNNTLSFKHDILPLLWLISLSSSVSLFYIYLLLANCDMLLLAKELAKSLQKDLWVFSIFKWLCQNQKAYKKTSECSTDSNNYVKIWFEMCYTNESVLRIIANDFQNEVEEALNKTHCITIVM